MSKFEALYYEDPAFWGQGRVEDVANLQRMEATAGMIPPSAESLLDVGCGNGVFARVAKRRNPRLNITCVDRSDAALEHVSADMKLKCEATSLPFEKRIFDCVTCLEVIEHLTIPDFERALAELARVANETLIISVPFKEKIELNSDTCPKCSTRFNRDLHFRSFSFDGFAAILDKHGFKLEKHLFPVPHMYYLGLPTYFGLKRKLAGKSNSHAFKSPICPLCGYVPENVMDLTQSASPAPSLPLTSAKSGLLKRLAKQLWPKYHTPGYWIIGRFSRCG